MRVWSRWVRCVRLPNQAARRAGRRWGAVGNEEPAGEEDADGLKKGAAALSQMLSLVNAAVPRDVQAAVKSLKPTGPMSLRERTVAAVVRKAGVVGVEFNVMHETGFELDIVAPGGVVCELDGPSHRSAGRQRIAELQRKLFEKRGIVIHRVDLIQRSVVEVLDGVADACTLPNDAKSKAAWDRVGERRQGGRNIWESSRDRPSTLFFFFESVHVHTLMVVFGCSCDCKSGQNTYPPPGGGLFFQGPFPRLNPLRPTPTEL
eukprot:Hpha_TRINITY_DN15811_c2_g5::TRINITY_DN15811_c2_g5_i2::g.187515::m.187515